MGLFDLFFKKKNNQETTIIPKDTGVIKKRTLDDLYINKDIEDLIWIADGIKKNYISEKKEEVYEFNGIKITFSSIQKEEPSLIFTDLPLEQVENIYDIERPSYYPTYSELTPQQKGVYWKLLSNPYNSSIDIGFVFILYYGLERHLLNGNFEKAFRVILKLRDVHKNKSFQNYSANALILTCVCRQRIDLAFEFMQSLDKDYEFEFSNNLFILCKYSLDISLTSKDIMRLAKSFEFKNTNYIKKYPEIFENILLDNLRSKYDSDGILISNFIKQSENKKVRKQSVPIFANMSIIDKSIEVPMLIENLELKKVIYHLLEETHNEVKIKLSELRKNGELDSGKIKDVKDAKILTFDESKEKDILLNLEQCGKDFFERHFILIGLQDFYYKYRDLDNKYLEKCIEYCFIDINSLEEMQKIYYDKEVTQIEKLSRIYSKDEIKKQISKIGKFNGNIPAFKRLTIIFEKQKEFRKAIEICEIAINYYKNSDMLYNVSDFKKRKDKLVSKVNI